MYQHCNRVNTTDPDNPLTHRVIWVRPGFDPFLTCVMIKYSNCTVNASRTGVKYYNPMQPADKQC